MAASVDTVIRGGLVVDGTGETKARFADVAIKDGLIVAVGPELSEKGADEIDASGLLVTPGWCVPLPARRAPWPAAAALSAALAVGRSRCRWQRCGRSRLAANLPTLTLMELQGRLPYSLRRASGMGPDAEPLVLARRHVCRLRQLRRDIVRADLPCRPAAVSRKFILCVRSAPCWSDDHDFLIELMEGVEDIPGTALHDGIKWSWETFPQFLDDLEQSPAVMDFAPQIGHAAIRSFVLGERCVDPLFVPSEEEVQLMADVVQEAVEAGAAGFSSTFAEIHMGEHPAPSSLAVVAPTRVH